MADNSTMDELKDCAVLVTNQGAVKPSEAILHLSSDFFVVDSILDLQRHFPGAYFV